MGTLVGPGFWSHVPMIKAVSMATKTLPSKSSCSQGMPTKNYNPDLSNWEEADFAEQLDDDVILEEAKFRERQHRQQVKREFEETRRRLAEEAVVERAREEAACQAAEEAKRSKERARAEVAKGKVSIASQSGTSTHATY